MQDVPTCPGVAVAGRDETLPCGTRTGVRGTALPFQAWHCCRRGGMGRDDARRDVLGCCCAGIGRHVAVRGLARAFGARRHRCMGGMGQQSARAFGVRQRRCHADTGRLVGWARASRLKYGAFVLSVVA